MCRAIVIRSSSGGKGMKVKSDRPIGKSYSRGYAQPPNDPPRRYSEKDAAKPQPKSQSMRKQSDRVWIETALVVAVVIMFWVFIGLLALMAFENMTRG